MNKQRVIRSICASICCICFCLGTSNAQIVINEYSAANLNQYVDSYGKTEDWIELYNTSSTSVDIGGWHVSDKEDKPTKWMIPAGTTIDGQGYLVVYCSGRNTNAKGELHTNFKLSQTEGKDDIVLADAAGVVLEAYELTPTLVESSHARSEDGSGDWLICTFPTLGKANTTTDLYKGYTATPTIETVAGFYEDEVTVTITNNDPNAVLRYTNDGTNPTNSNSIVYTAPILVSKTTAIKALAFSEDPTILNGMMDFATYFINESFTVPVFSVAADQVLELAGGEGELIPIGSIEYFKDEIQEAKSFGSLNRHGQDSWVLDHRSLDWISRDEMGYSKAVKAPIFNYSKRDEYQKFMFRNSGDDNYPAIEDEDHEGSTHIRDEYVQQLALDGEMALDIRANERVILFLNGQYWGLYGMRERPVDHDYTDEYYDQGKYDLQYLSTWMDTEVEYGDTTALLEWRSLRDFILENDMADPDNYQIAKDSLNMTSLIDYMLVNLNVVASDWLNYNTGWWRGRNPKGDHKKWGYILWDLDATFDYYINYTGVPNTTPDAKPCDIEVISDAMDSFFPPETGLDGPDISTCPTVVEGTVPYEVDDSILVQVMLQDNYCCNSEWDGQCEQLYQDISQGFEDGSFNALENIQGNVGKHEKIFLKLIDESPEFKQLYYSRYADLANTVFSCDNMIGTLDSMLAIIEPEMPKQISRWGGTMSEWKANVDQLKDFILQRCSNLGNVILDCTAELSGPHAVTLMTRPAVGEIDFNTLDIESFPWTGNYYAGMENNIKAKVFKEFEDNYVFSHWESSAESTITPSMTDRKAMLSIASPDTLTAVFASLSSTPELQIVQGFSVWPNPAVDQVQIQFDNQVSGHTRLAVTNLLGQEIKILHNGHMAVGEVTHTLQIDNRTIAPGVYYVTLSTKLGKATRKLSIVAK